MTSSAHAPCANVASFVYTFETEPPQQQSSPKALIFNAHHKTPQANNNAHPNRHSFPCSNNIWQQHQQQMQQVQELQEKSSYQTPPPSPGRAARGPRLSLDTSQERLHKFTVIQHNNQSYLKLFTPTLVESPVSFLSANQQLQDKKLWENGPDEALQKKMEMERREVYQARSKQQLRGFLLGIWLGCLMGLLIVQQTAAKVYIPIHLASLQKRNFKEKIPTRPRRHFPPPLSTLLLSFSPRRQPFRDSISESDAWDRQHVLSLQGILHPSCCSKDTLMHSNLHQLNFTPSKKSTMHALHHLHLHITHQLAMHRAIIFQMYLSIILTVFINFFTVLYLSRRDTSPLLLFMVFMSCFAAVRSGTRCMVAAIATCAAVLTCFATLIANHSVEFGVYKSVQGSSFRSTSNESP
ncbi:hypothetical protein EDD21DRAFT_173171 [Dissophora ornata]|nr:hypothetical protein EDD21DRAFT_173171 [Dissophora ornata]